MIYRDKKSSSLSIPAAYCNFQDSIWRNFVPSGSPNRTYT